MSISFVIPARNEEDQIGKTIERILNQNRPDLIKEIIVADNGSTDKTAEIAARYPKTKVVHEPILGTNRARQAGFLASSGDIIAFIDADNWIAPDWAENAVRLLSDPKTAALTGPYIYRETNWFGNFFGFYSFTVFAKLVQWLLHDLLKIGSIGIGGNMAVKREALKKIGGLDTDYQFWGDDTDTAKRLSKIGKVKLTTKLRIFASPRRFQKHGWIKVMILYFLNFAWVTLFNKPFTK